MENQIEIIGNREIELLEKNRKINIQKLFTQEGMDAVIAEIKNEVHVFMADGYDVTQKQDRAKIVSMAAKVAKCKAPIKNLSMELKEDSRKFINSVNEQWNRYESEMDALRDKIRKPVDEIEEREAAELKARQDRLAQIQYLNQVNSCAIEIDDRIKFFEKVAKDIQELAVFDWGDFKFKAESLASEAILVLNLKIADLTRQKEQEAELTQLKKEKAEREQKDREEQIAREAAEKARLEAEERAEKERKAEEARRLQIEEDKKRAEAAKLAAEERAREAERLRVEQEAQAEERRIAAEKKAKDDAEKAAAEAVEKERLRIAEEKRKEDEAAEKREANKRHCAKINNEAAQAIAKILNKLELQECDFETIDKKIVEAIAKGEVPHVKIIY